MQNIPAGREFGSTEANGRSLVWIVMAGEPLLKTKQIFKPAENYSLERYEQ